MKARAVFFDRDGVLNEVIDRGENFFVQGKKVRWTAPFSYEEFCPKAEVIKVLQAVQAAGFLTILITNQPDVAYGNLPQKEYERIMSDVKKWPLTDIFVCTHGRDENCLCKKPKPGMFHDAAKKWDIDLENSFMVGDTESDLKAADTVGIRSILLRAPYNEHLTAAYEVATLDDLIFLFKSGKM